MRKLASLLMAAALVGPVSSSLAQPRRATTSPNEARAQFGVIVQAAQELANVIAAGRNVRGGLQSWDRRWRSRLRGLGRAVLPAADASCGAREVAELVDGAAAAVWTARTFVFSQTDDSLVPLARELAARRILADEAARRRTNSSSCTDLPDLAETERSLREVTVAALLEIARRGRAPGL